MNIIHSIILLNCSQFLQHTVFYNLKNVSVYHKYAVCTYTIPLCGEICSVLFTLIPPGSCWVVFFFFYLSQSCNPGISCLIQCSSCNDGAAWYLPHWACNCASCHFITFCGACCLTIAQHREMSEYIAHFLNLVDFLTWWDMPDKHILWVSLLFNTFFPPNEFYSSFVTGAAT